MNAPSEDIKDILASTSSLALTYATDLFIGEMPTSPNQCVCVYDTGGQEPDVDRIYEKPTIQIRVRGERGAYRTTQELTQACRDVLHGTANYTINSARYIGIWCNSDVMFIGMDDNSRPLFTVNFRIHRTTA